MARDWRSAPLDDTRRAMCDFAERLARSAGGTDERDIAALRAAGLDDRAVLDLVLIVAYYSYVNRIAEALGVPLEPERGGPPEGAH